MDEFTVRLKELIDYLGITPILLADRMGVQRSTFSHLFSGRNKPGFEFLVKLQQVYPEINLHWLVSGSGSMTITTIHNFSQPEIKPEETDLPVTLYNNIFTQPQVPEEKEESSKKEKGATATEENLDRMILVYTNGKMVEIKGRG